MLTIGMMFLSSFLSMNLFVCAEPGITFTAHIVKFHPPFCCDPYCCNPPWQLKAVMGWFSVYRSQNVCQTFLYARLKNGHIMPWQCPSVHLSVCPSVRPSVRLSVCPSVRPSVRVFRTFLEHALRYQFETWYIHSVGGTTCRV